MPSLTKIHADFVGPLSSGTASSPILKFGDSSTTGIFSPNTGEIAFSTSGQSQAVTFKTDGKVGIGINSPAYNLDVIGDINFTGTLRQNGSAFSGGGGGGGGGGSNWTTSGNNIYRQSKVGINQNNPTDNLEILHTNGNGITFKTSQDHYAQITSDVNRTGGDSFLLALEGKWNGTPVSEIALVTGSDTTNKDDGEIIFRTSSANNLSSNERLRITSNGTVQLTSDAVEFASGTGYISAKGSGDLVFRTTNSYTERLRITSGGLVRVPDNGKFVAGTGEDLEIYHDGTNSYINSINRSLYIDQTADNFDIIMRNDDGSGGLSNYIQLDGSEGSVILSHYGNTKLSTTSTGVTVTGTLAATAVTGDGSGLTSINATTLDGESKSYYTGYTDTAIANLVDSSPSTLNTLNELAAALGDDANFSTTVTTSIAAKLPLAGGTMTGTLNMGSNNITTTGKVLFANMYSALGDLPSASTYHGMFAHVHGTGKGYFAHGGNWIRLLDTNDEGSGNGLDADTVDGQEGSYYLNYNNFTNTPTIPTNNNQLTNGAGYVTSNTQLSNEQVQDIVGGMVSSNTESGITVTYEDSDGTLDFAVASQTDNNFTTTLKNKLDGIESSATADQTAAEILTAIKTVDGSGSGLNADKLDDVELSGIVQRTFEDASRNLIIKTNSTSSGAGVEMRLSNNTFQGQLYFNSTSSGFLESSWGSWDLQKTRNGTLALRISNTNYNVAPIHTGNYDGTYNIPIEINNFLYRNPSAGGVTITGNTGQITTPSHGNSSQWNTAYGWGNHASASYVTSTSATTFTGDLTISKADAKLKLYSTDSSSPNYPGIDFDTANGQGATLECNIFDNELPTAGLGLVVKKSASNTETGTLTFNVLGDIYTGGTSLSTVNKVLTTDSNGNLLLPDGKHIYMSGYVNDNTFNIASLFVDAIKCGNIRIHDGRETSGGSSHHHNTTIGNSARTFGYADGDKNTAVGSTAGRNMTTGHDNTVLGYRAQYSVTTGSYGTFVGVDSGKNKQYGDYCTAIGYSSDFYTTTGSTNATANYSNTTCLGYDSRTSGSNQVVAGNTSAVLHYYGLSNRSDERDKIDIQDEFLGLDFIKKLKPRAYKWDYRDDYFDEVFDEVEDPDNPGEFEKVARLVPVPKDGSRSGTRLHHGLIAQEVKELIDETGVDFAGYQDSKVKNGEDVLSMNYLELIAPMIKAIQEQQSQIEALTAMIESMK